MATIVVLNGRHEGEWYTVGVSPLTFGRDDGILAQIIDPRVSRDHLRVFRDAKTGDYIAEDLNSRNGSRVNGRPIESYVLADGDLIQIGHTILAFTTGELSDEELIEGFVEKMRGKAGNTLENIENREQYTEAAALFSRIFRWKK